MLAIFMAGLGLFFAGFGHFLACIGRLNDGKAAGADEDVPSGQRDGRAPTREAGSP